MPGATEDVCPAQINEELTKKMQKLAEEACKTLGIVTYSRADVLMKKDSSMYCIEVNTLPGMTVTSLCHRKQEQWEWNFHSFVNI